MKSDYKAREREVDQILAKYDGAAFAAVPEWERLGLLLKAWDELDPYKDILEDRYLGPQRRTFWQKMKGRLTRNG